MLRKMDHPMDLWAIERIVLGELLIISPPKDVDELVSRGAKGIALDRDHPE